MNQIWRNGRDSTIVIVIAFIVIVAYIGILENHGVIQLVKLINFIQR